MILKTWSQRLIFNVTLEETKVLRTFMPYIQVRQIAHRGFRTFLLGQDGPNVYTFYNRGLEIFEDVIAKVQRQYFLINYLLNDPGNCQQASYSFSD